MNDDREQARREAALALNQIDFCDSDAWHWSAKHCGANESTYTHGRLVGTLIGLAARDAAVEALEAANAKLQRALADALAEKHDAMAKLREAQGAIRYANDNILDYDDAEWRRWAEFPAVQAALKGGGA